MDAIGNTKTTKKRIEYIDLMKGLCILTVVALHFKLFPEKSSLNYMRGAISIPLYFFLSGIFYKTYKGFIDLCIRKINKLIIPLIFFSTLFLIVGLPAQWVSHGLLFPQTSISIFLFNNYPLWFLKALFIANLLYYFIFKYIPNDIIKTFICFALCWIGIYLSNKYIPIMELINKQTNLFNALIGLIFMHIGMLSNKYNIIRQTLSKTKINLLILCTFLVLLLTATDNTDFFQRKYNANYINFLLASTSGAFFVLFISQKIQKLFLISFLGRYSLIVLGTHLIYQGVFSPILIHFIKQPQVSTWISFIITITLLYTIGIKIIIKLFPQFSAQKDLFTYKH